MIGGFALVAYPARYGVSGVMTFLISHEGAVYQKDLGPQTAPNVVVTDVLTDPLWADYRDLAMVKKLFDVLGPRYKDRHGGYTRVLKAGFRYGDSAPMAIIATAMSSWRRIAV